MSRGYTIENVREIEDLTVEVGLSERGKARFPREDLEAEAAGASFEALRPGKGQPVGHRRARTRWQAAGAGRSPRNGRPGRWGERGVVSAVSARTVGRRGDA